MEGEIEVYGKIRKRRGKKEEMKEKRNEEGRRGKKGKWEREKRDEGKGARTLLGG